MKRLLMALGAATLLLAGAPWPARAQAAAAASAAAPLAEGEIRRVDREAGKLTIKHGEIRSLDMPPMTMVFGVRDRAWLERVKAGDRVRFQAAQVAGQYVVTELQPMR